MKLHTSIHCDPMDQSIMIDWSMGKGGWQHSLSIMVLMNFFVLQLARLAWCGVVSPYEKPGISTADKIDLVKVVITIGS